MRKQALIFAGFLVRMYGSRLPEHVISTHLADGATRDRGTRQTDWQAYLDGNLAKEAKEEMMAHTAIDEGEGEMVAKVTRFAANLVT